MELKQLRETICKKFNPGAVVRSMKLFCILGCVVVIAGCASTEDTGRMQWDINELRAEINKLKNNSQGTARMEKVNSKLDEFQNSQKSANDTVADLMIQVQSLTSEYQVLTGRFEEARYVSEKSAAELLESKDMLLAKMKEIEIELADVKKELEKIKTTPPPPPPPVKQIEPPKTEDKKKTADVKDIKKDSVKAEKTEAGDDIKTVVKDIYMAAYQAFKEGRNHEAREKFLSVMNDFPANDYSDNARFWIGETYYKEEKFEDAILAYQELFDKNPNSDKVPGAMLKQGLAFYALKDEKTGKIILEKLIEKYPESEQAALAKRKINKPAVPPKNTKK